MTTADAGDAAEKPKGKGEWKIYLGMAVVAVVALVVWGMIESAWEHKKNAAAASWPSTPGRITASEVSRSESQNRDGDRTVHYGPSVSYSYAVNGTSYTGSRIRFGLDYESQAESAADVAPYPVGTAVTVYYDPQKPTESVLQRVKP